MNRHYRVWRSPAPAMGPNDRQRVATVGLSPHEDDSFAAPLTRHILATSDPDVSVDAATGRISWIDRSISAGVRYHYSVSHVGNERTESRRTAEVVATVPPPPPGQDVTPPKLAILHPTDEWWSAFPHIVLAYADGESGVDPASLSVRFDVPVGTLPAGAELASQFQRRDDNAYVLALDETQALPQGLARLTASIADRQGNVATRTVAFNISVVCPQRPTASFSAAQVPPGGPLLQVASGAGDADGLILRWEWYWGDGEMSLGQNATHLYRAPGSYALTHLVRDDEGGVTAGTTTVTVTSVDVDSDGDGVLDPADCAPLEPLASARPGEIRPLLAARRGAGVELVWPDPRLACGPGTAIDVASAALSAHRAAAGGAMACVEGDVLGASVVRPSAPPPGDGEAFLVRARSACGDGTWGSGRSIRACP